MIDEQNPDEDRITHIDLLNRILGMNGHIDKNKEEFIYQVEALRGYLSNVFDDKIRENQNNMDKFDKSLDAKFSDFKKDIFKMNQATVDGMISRLEDTLGKIEKRFTGLQENVYAKIDTAEASFLKESKDGLSNSKKELEFVMNNTASGMTARINDMRRYLDTRLSNLEEATLRTAQVEVDKQLADVTSRAKEAQESLETYRKEMNQAFTKYQAESMAKMNELSGIFKQLREKFAVISKSLQ